MSDPALAAARAQAEAQQSILKAQKRSMLPGFSVGFLHEWEMGDQFTGFSLSVTLPFLTKRRSVKAASLRLDAMRLNENMELLKLQSQLMAEYNTAMELRSLLEKYQPVMNDFSSLDLLKKAYEGGQINFITYLQETNFFLTARRDFLDTEYRYQLAIIRLSRYN